MLSSRLPRGLRNLEHPGNLRGLRNLQHPGNLERPRGLRNPEHLRNLTATGGLWGPTGLTILLTLPVLFWAGRPVSAQEAGSAPATANPPETQARPAPQAPAPATATPPLTQARPAPQAPGPAATLLGAFEGGRLSLGLRYRYEAVDDGAFSKNAHASTLQSSLGFETDSFHGWFAGFRLENVASVGNDELYDNRGSGRLDNDVGNRPAVADPSLAQVDQAYLGFRGPRGLELRAGRIAYTLDNQRFVGTAAWRQNHRSFDAASLSVGSTDLVQARYAYLGRVHYNTGASPRLDGHLIHLRSALGLGHLSGYAYLLDWRSAQRSTLSSSTLGLRFQGTAELARFDALYFAEYARQQDYGDNPDTFDLDYVHLGLGARSGAWTLQLAWEMKEGDGIHSLQTPLGTNHGKNGFADKLVATPPQGSHDLYLRLSMDRDRWSWLIGLHEFRAVEVSGTLGRELDAQVRYSPRPDLSLFGKLAAYRAETLSSDTTKLMLWASWSLDLVGSHRSTSEGMWPL
jgi:hypothetical protein